MDSTSPDSNIIFTSSYGENVTLSTSTTTSTTPAVVQPPSHPSDLHDPEFTIMVVLGLSLLLVGLAVFLALCRRSEPEEDFERSCAPGERLTGGKGMSTEPQLKTWRRLGSYRRSYNLSFRRPPHRRPQQHDRSGVSAPSQTPRPESSLEPHITTPCLFDYVTEI